MLIRTAIAEIAWPIRSVRGRVAPDDGYAIFGSLCRRGLVFHGQPDTQVAWVGSELIIRAPVDRAWRLAGCELAGLEVGGATLRLNPPVVRPLVPARSLWSRCVTIKPYLDPDQFTGALRRQLDRIGVDRSAPARVGPRRVLRVRGVTLVGFRVALPELSIEDSLAVQSHGIGGKNRMGCGVFTPC